MELLIDAINTYTFLEDLHRLSGARICIFDTSFNELISFPVNQNNFCGRVRATPEGQKRCRASDIKALKIAEDSKTNYFYFCHAGLCESVVPIVNGETIIGYLMIGQFLSRDISIDCLWANTKKRCESVMETEDLKNFYYSIPRLNSKQTAAYSHIMNACALYIAYKDFIKINCDETFGLLNSYIDEHLMENLSAPLLSKKLLVPKNKIYGSVKAQTSLTLNQFIRKKRLDRAVYMMEHSNHNISEIALLSGIGDFNYFSRIFKNEFGVSPSQYRKNLKNANSQ